MTSCVRHTQAGQRDVGKHYTQQDQTSLPPVMSDAEATAFIYSAHRRPLAPSHPIFEAGNLDRELLARARAPEVGPCFYVLCVLRPVGLL